MLTLRRVLLDATRADYRAMEYRLYEALGRLTDAELEEIAPDKENATSDVVTAIFDSVLSSVKSDRRRLVVTGQTALNHDSPYLPYMVGAPVIVTDTDGQTHHGNFVELDEDTVCIESNVRQYIAYTHIRLNPERQAS